MYANQDGWQLNPHRQFAFLRKWGREVLLVVANFDGMPAHVAVNVPQHAFDFWKMSPMADVKAKDLLTDTVEQISFCADKPVVLDIPAFGGKMLKIRLSR